MNEDEKKLSEYIDRLNMERAPEEDEGSTASEERKELYRAVRVVRSLKNPAMPAPGFADKLLRAAAAAEKQTAKTADIRSSGGRAGGARGARRKRWPWVVSAAGVAAAVALLANFAIPWGGGGQPKNVVSAMTQAYKEVAAYHGTLTIVATSENGNTSPMTKQEVWADQDGHYYTKVLEGTNEGLVTVNNGERKWQLQPDSQEAELFPAFPDGYRFEFELGNEIGRIGEAASVKEAGEGTVEGRAATVVEVTPDGGLPYRIWLDKETKLPLQKQSAMLHAVQITATYSQLTFADAIPQDKLAYQLPDGYKEVATDPEQLVADVNEAQAAVGFAPAAPNAVPSGYERNGYGVVPDRKLARTYYRTTGGAAAHQVVVEQYPASGDFKPDNNAMLGSLEDGTTVEIISAGTASEGIASVRWQQDGYEFKVLGDRSTEELANFAQSYMNGQLQMPSASPDESSGKGQVQVPYDLEVEKSDQKSVDGGSSPWRLDPLFVAQVFASLQLSPDGITGEYPVTMEELTLESNDGKDAVVVVNDKDALSSKIYLERVVRQDDSGIWTVVGYDPR